VTPGVHSVREGFTVSPASIGQAAPGPHFASPDRTAEVPLSRYTDAGAPRFQTRISTARAAAPMAPRLPLRQGTPRDSNASLSTVEPVSDRTANSCRERVRRGQRRRWHFWRRLHILRTETGRSSRLRRQSPEGQNHKVTAVGIDAEGKPISSVVTWIYNGLPHPVTGTLNFDAIATTRVDAYTTIISRTKAGKLVRTSIDVVSRDGKTLTDTTAGIEANGRQFNIINVYDKQ